MDTIENRYRKRFVTSGRREFASPQLSIIGRDADVNKYTADGGTSFQPSLKSRKKPQNVQNHFPILLLLMLISTSFLALIFQPYFQKNQPISSAAREVLPRQNENFAKLLNHNAKKTQYLYNQGYTGPGDPKDLAMEGYGSPRIHASFNTAGSEGMTVTDPIEKISLTMKPRFQVGDGMQDQNQLFYPLNNKDGYLVYTAQITGVKEDILLSSYKKDRITFEYELDVPSRLEARMEIDGSIGVYGSDLPIYGNIPTGTDKDAQLLEKARKNAVKNKLLFRIPAPVVVETDKTASNVKAYFELKGSSLNVIAEGLKDASYPLSIDPSVYVETAQKLMRGNNETNLDFDVNNELIQKGKLTGARFNQLTSTLDLPSARWNHTTAVMGGYVYAVGGNNGSANQAGVYWSKFNTSTYALESPNPGDGACSNWCTSSAYNLPAVRAGHSMVAYNGFLYVMGGLDGSGAHTNTIYIAKIGLNGEPSLWHPTDTDKNNWVYWYQSPVTLTSERSYAAAAVYNNYLYLLGGQTNAAAGGVTTVEYTTLSPLGTLASWTTTGMTALPSARHSHSAQIYNDRLYLIGGNSSGTLQNTVHYIKIKSDGTLVSSWAAGNAFSTTRQSWGGNFSTIWGGYLYVSGGCAAIDAEGECTATGITNGGGVEIASINADGSLSSWSSISGVTNARIGYGFVGCRNTLYTVGGCTAQNTTTGACTTVSTAVSYGVINPDGDATVIGLSQPSGSGSCVSSDPYNCDLPPAGDGVGESGQMISPTAIMNGFLYVIGGCADVGDNTQIDCEVGERLSSNTVYAAISSDGTLRRPPSCVGQYYGSWCVDNTNHINGNAGVAGAATAVYEGRIYVIGGFDASDGGAREISSVELNADGSLKGGWTSQSFANLGIPLTTGDLGLSFTYAYARANPASAGVYPGNLYIFGGCNDFATGVSCDGYSTAVFKCNITTTGLLEEADANDCDTANQLQIDSETTGGSQGLGVHSGAVYANYIYLVGGNSDNEDNRDSILYAKFDNNNNVVAVSGSAWQNTTEDMSVGRQYGAAFGYNGFLYVLGGYDSGGAADNLEFAKIDVSTGDIGPFSTSTVSISGRWGFSVQVTNSYAYVLGGCDTGAPPPPSTTDCSSFAPTVQTFQIHNNSSGTPAGFTSSSSLFATDRFGAGAVVHNGYIYIAGGCVASNDCDNATNIVEYALLNDDGSIGSWTAETGTGNLPADRVFGQLEVAGGTLYFIGGQNDGGTAQSTVYYATPASNGDITSWSTASNSLPGPRTQLSAASWNNRIFVTGGADGGASCTNGVCNTVYVSPQLNSGGNIGSSWTSATGFNVARKGHTTIAYANNLYVLGGLGVDDQLSDSQFTQINSDGSLDSWTYTTSLPQKLFLMDGFAANGYMYLFGGKEGDLSCNKNTFVAPISANTTIASGNNPTGVGEWFVTNQKFNGERSGASAVYYEGKAYVLGGACGSLEGNETVVMEDDFDAALDSSMWASTANMSVVSTSCGITVSSGNSLLSSGNNTAQAITKDVDVSSGGKISFILYIPTANGSGCTQPGGGEHVLLEYSTNGGSTWATSDVIATYNENQYGTPTLIEETIPLAARTSSTRFRLYIPNADSGQDQWAIDNFSIAAFDDSPPSTQVFEDNFDPSIDAADWISTNNMSVGTNCGTIGSGNSIVSTGGNQARAETIGLNLQYGGLISFKLRIPTSSTATCNDPENNEDLELQYSTNNGSNWSVIAVYDESAYNTTTAIQVELPTTAYSNNVRLRWILPNASPNDDEWALDDITVDAYGSVLAYTKQHRVTSTSLLSQPQLAKYSRMIDTDTDVFPTKWLMNGLDNDVGARWYIRYRSSTNANSSWGQETNFGRVTLGQPENYTPLDGSGANTFFARYYYMAINIDSSQSFGYPEDVSRGPTIDDLTLFFTSDPSKRLRHGKTFTGGQLQPLDTPF